MVQNGGVGLLRFDRIFYTPCIAVPYISRKLKACVQSPTTYGAENKNKRELQLNNENKEETNKDKNKQWKYE